MEKEGAVREYEHKEIETESMEIFEQTVSYHWSRVPFPKRIPPLSVSRKLNHRDPFKGQGCYLVAILKRAISLSALLPICK